MKPLQALFFVRGQRTSDIHEYSPSLFHLGGTFLEPQSSVPDALPGKARGCCYVNFSGNPMINPTHYYSRLRADMASGLSALA